MNEQELILRVFKVIAHAHFRDHKLGPEYCHPIHFDRGLGDDIAEYIKNNDWQYYKQKREEYARIKIL